MAENVFVITATNKLISQKLSTTRQTMKKKQDMKNSESITEYINVDHYHRGTRDISDQGSMMKKSLTVLAVATMNTCRAE